MMNAIDVPQRQGLPSGGHVDLVPTCASVSPEDGAWYQCTAQNAAGSTATRAKLYVDTGPAPPAGEPWRLHLPKPTRVSRRGCICS